MTREAVFAEDRVRREKRNATRQHQTLPGLEKLRQGSLPVPGQPVSYDRVCLRKGERTTGQSWSTKLDPEQEKFDCDAVLYKMLDEFLI